MLSDPSNRVTKNYKGSHSGKNSAIQAETSTDTKNKNAENSNDEDTFKRDFFLIFIPLKKIIDYL